MMFWKKWRQCAWVVLLLRFDPKSGRSRKRNRHRADRRDRKPSPSDECPSLSLPPFLWCSFPLPFWRSASGCSGSFLPSFCKEVVLCFSIDERGRVWWNGWRMRLLQILLPDLLTLLTPTWQWEAVTLRPMLPNIHRFRKRPAKKERDRPSAADPTDPRWRPPPPAEALDVVKSLSEAW